MLVKICQVGSVLSVTGTHCTDVRVKEDCILRTGPGQQLRVPWELHRDTPQHHAIDKSQIGSSQSIR